MITFSEVTNSLEVTYLLGATIFLAKFACSVGSTCIKGVDIENTCIEGSYTKRVYIKGICFSDAYIRDISTYVNNAYTRCICSKGVNIWNACIKPSCIGSTFVWDVDSEGIDDGDILSKGSYTRNVCAIEGIYMYATGAYITSLYAGNTWIRGIYIGSTSVTYACIKSTNTKRACIGTVYIKSACIGNISTYASSACIGV